MKTTLKLMAVCLAVVSLAGCETLKNLYAKPETQAALEGVKQMAFSAAYAGGTEAARQVATGEQFNGGKVAIVSGAAALYTAAGYIRQLQSTKAVLDPWATEKELLAAGLPKADATKLAETITSNAQLLKAQGVPADEASEINAQAFDAAAAAIQAGK